MYGKKLIVGAVRKLAWKCLEKKAVADSDMLIDIRISKVDPEVYIHVIMRNFKSVL